MNQQQRERTWLDVPFADKDAAKAYGARWDPTEKRWYDPGPPTPELARWTALPDIPELLPGEDRTFGSGLFVDMVPSSCWFTNVRSCVSQQDWERLRRMITRRAGQRCEICGRPEDRATQRWLEAHERWRYDPATHTQSLRRLICLCTDCHTTTHLGLANLRGRAEHALAHLATVTGWTPSQIDAHVAAANSAWLDRSQHVWTLNLDMLVGAGITIARAPEPQQRGRAADSGLPPTSTDQAVRPARVSAAANDFTAPSLSRPTTMTGALPTRAQLMRELRRDTVLRRVAGRLLRR